MISHGQLDTAPIRLRMLALACLLAFLPGLRAAVISRGPYLQSLTSTSVVIQWRTDVPAAGRLLYGTNAAALNVTVLTGASSTNQLAILKGLEPATRYYYAVGTTSQILTGGVDHFVETAPAAGSAVPTRVWVLGDSGTANASARSVRDAYLRFTGSRPADLVLMLGDNAYESGTEAEFQAAVFAMYPMVLRQAPLWPALGNHDAGNSTSPPATLPYFSIFTLPTAGEAGGQPSGTERYYSFDYGNIHFVCLDSYTSSRATNGAMLNWLRSDLARSASEWLIAYWHHPPYSAGGSGSDSTTESMQMRAGAVRLLEDAGVDLVLAGHSHGYERSYLIDGHYGSSSTFQPSMKRNGGNGRENGDGAYLKLGPPWAHQGTVYVVAGSSGRTEGGPFNHPAMAFSISALGSMVLDIEGTRLDAKFIDATGAVRDSFTIRKVVPNQVVILEQPASQVVHRGTNVSFQVRALSNTPITYQWRRDGFPLPGATNSWLHLTNVSEADEAIYDVVATDRAGPVASAPARLAIAVLPTILQSPVDVTVAEGRDAILSVESRGTLPMGYRWRRAGTTLTNMILASHQSFLRIPGATTGDQGSYTVVVSNGVFGTLGVLSAAARLTVLADLDRDGLGDAWEAQFGLSPTDADDARSDADADGLSALEEHDAGTNPLEQASALRLEWQRADEPVRLRFTAVSNRTYTIEQSESPAPSAWRRLIDVPAAATNRLIDFHDTPSGGQRYYRLRTPRVP